MKKGVGVNMQNDLEARPIALLVQKANQFSSQIYMESGDNKRVNVKSIMGMMSMGFTEGQEITVIADGKDEAAAVKEISEYLTANA